MATTQGIHLLYKRLGETPLECVRRFKKTHPAYADVKMTYAGRLDPLAEGLLLVLSGKEVNNKNPWLGLEKTYTVEILWGIGTDTGDVLGMIEGFSPEPAPSIEKVSDALSKAVGKFAQSYPAYSSRFFEKAREGTLDRSNLPVHDVELKHAIFVSRREIKTSELAETILRKINTVQGDFRQKDIQAAWQKYLENREEMYTIDTVSLAVSSGFYVRQFVSDVAHTFGLPALAFHIMRTAIGPYTSDNLHTAKHGD